MVGDKKRRRKKDNNGCLLRLRGRWAEGICQTSQTKRTGRLWGRAKGQWLARKKKRNKGRRR